MNNELPSATPPDDDKDLSGLGRDLLGGSTPASGSNPRAGWQPPTVEELHAILPQYEVSRMLGRGGMGAVYMGWQISLDRPVAIKILSGALEEDDFGFKERFKNEARAMAKLSHPGIIAVHDFGETAEGLLYIVMEYVDGTDVARMIAAEGRLHTEYAMAITAHVCDALAYAHARGIIHRDIKPANVMVGYDGVVKVADFGLAKVHAGEGRTLGLTMSGMAMGTMHFIAPEALEYGATVDHRADLYAVGVMLFQMLTGKLPQGMFRMPSLQVPGMDPRYDGIIARAMYEDREQRYQSATELRVDLDGILTQPVEKVEAEDTKPAAALPTMARPQRPGGRKKGGTGARRPVPEKATSQGWGVWAAVIVLCGGGAAAWLYLGGEEPIETKPVEQVSSPTRTDRVESPTTPSSASTLVSLSTVPAVTKDQSFVNSLGMKFVPVPGTEVLFCIHETRFRDYAAYAAENPGIDQSWRNQKVDGYTPLERAEEHPVTRVNWEDAEAFAVWLSRKEGIPYRLPTDQEWSLAAGLEGKEQWSPGRTPESLSGKVEGVYPWGNEWPPPAGAGNYSDQSRKTKAPRANATYLDSYDDGFPTTAPVMSFRPNPFGLWDMGGNVKEWVQDWLSISQDHRVMRGNSWHSSAEVGLRSSDRGRDNPDLRFDSFGFRLVLADAIPTGPGGVSPGDAKVTPTTTSPTQPMIPAGEALFKVSSGTKENPFTNTLGMKFVPVPITGGLTGGENVLFSIWETRVQDYEAFVAATKRGWLKPKFAQESSHPVVQMNVEDAEAFCSWLTELDRKSGKIGTTELYRLPTDHEWSCAVGVGDLENPSSPPGEKGNKITDVYPWGSVYPPSQTSGNFGGAEFLPDSGKSRKDSGHYDAHAETAPVGSYSPNKYGIFDLGGNAWEWVDDKFDAAKKEGVLRGASFFDSGFVTLASSHRSPRDQVFRHWTFGFRVVIAPANSLSGNNRSTASFASSSPPKSAAILEEATKEKPFENSLGMKFVPVPGTSILMCIHETRRQDYLPYANETPGVAGRLKDQTLGGFVVTDRMDEHPIIGVNWTDSKAFCEWLSKKEGRIYRLPTDREWSHAVGIGSQEDWSKNITPATRSRKVAKVWPWGKQWPLPDRAGNYSDQSRKEKAPTPGASYLDGYNDGYPTTAPVMSFAPNPFGIYDLGGNVWEWCEDWWDSTETGRVLRGGTWTILAANELLSSNRSYREPGARGGDFGFRVVVELPSSPSVAVVADSGSAQALSMEKNASPSSLPPSVSSPDASTIQQLPEIFTRITNYQKVRHAQLSDLTAKYRAALVSAKASATNGGALDEVVATDSAITAATTLAELIEKNLGATEVVPLPPLTSPGESSPARLAELHKIFVREVSKIEATLAMGLDQSLEAAQVALVQSEKIDEARTLEAYRKQFIAAFSSLETSPPESAAATDPTPAAAATPWPADRQYRSNGGFRTWSSEANDSGTDLRQLRGVGDPVQLLMLGSGWVVLRANGEVVSNIDRVKAWKEISRICRGDDGRFALITRQGELIIHPEPTDKANEVPKDLGPVRDAYVSANRQVAILEDGGLVAWGRGHDGETAPGNPEWKDKPVLPAERTAVAMSNVPAAMALRLDDGALLRWGANGGQGRFTANFQNTMSSGFAINGVGLHAIPKEDAPIIAWSWRGGDPLSPFPTDVRGAEFINTNRHFLVLGRDGKLVLDPMCQERDISAALDLVTGSDPRLISVQLPERAGAVSRLLWFDPTAVPR